MVSNDMLTSVDNVTPAFLNLKMPDLGTSQAYLSIDLSINQSISYCSLSLENPE